VQLHLCDMLYTALHGWSLLANVVIKKAVGSVVGIDAGTGLVGDARGARNAEQIRRTLQVHVRETFSLIVSLPCNNLQPGIHSDIFTSVIKIHSLEIDLLVAHSSRY